MSIFLTGFAGQLNTGVSTVIANGATASGVITLGGFSLVGIKVPASFTGTVLTFTMCDTLAGTYVPVKTTASGTALSYTVASSGYYAIDPKDFYGINFLKIVSGTTEVGAKTLVCSLKGF